MGRCDGWSVAVVVGEGSEGCCVLGFVSLGRAIVGVC